MYVERSIETRSGNHCCCGRAVSITQSECVFVDLEIQHAMRMRHIVICDRPSIRNFSTFSHKRHDLRKTSY